MSPDDHLKPFVKAATPGQDVPAPDRHPVWGEVLRQMAGSLGGGALGAGVGGLLGGGLGYLAGDRSSAGVGAGIGAGVGGLAGFSGGSVVGDEWADDYAAEQLRRRYAEEDRLDPPPDPATPDSAPGYDGPQHPLDALYGLSDDDWLGRPA